MAKLPAQKPIPKRPVAAPRRRRPTAPWVIGAVGVAAAIIALLWWRAGPHGDVQVTRATAQATERPSRPAVGSLEPVATENRNVAAPTAVDDSTGTLLWASPTSGDPISLAWTPPGAQCFVHLRPASLMAHPEGEKILAALGPWGRAAVERLSAVTGCELSELESVTLAVVIGDSGEIDATLRAELTNPWTDAELAKRFPAGKDAQAAGRSYRIVGDRACWLAGNDGRTLVVCPARLAAEALDLAGEPPQLVRDLESLIERSDSERTASIILAPRLLDASGSRLLTAAAAPLREALRWLVGREATAVALSADLQENSYFELRAVPALNVPPRRLANTLAGRMRSSAAPIEAAVAAQPSPPYGREVLARFPKMMAVAASYSRAGEDGKQAVVNCYLPAIAGHNVLMGAELLLTQTGRGAGAPDSIQGASLTVEERLAKTTSLTFAKDSLQRALELLADDLEVEIHIEGRDLQADGITKNQSFAIDLRDAPGREILVEVLRRANPDRSAESPADPRQKLVYAVQAPESGNGGRIIVTTRAAAEKRGLPLPAEFLGTAE